MPRDNTPPLGPPCLTAEQRREMERNFFDAAIRLAAQNCGLKFDNDQLMSFCNELAQILGLQDARARQREVSLLT